MTDSETSEPSTDEAVDSEELADIPSAEEDTSDSPEGQVEEGNSEENSVSSDGVSNNDDGVPRTSTGMPIYRAPTVDENRSDNDVTNAISHFLTVVGEKMEYEEKMKLVKVNSQGLHQVYYDMFSRNANGYMRLLVSYKRRRKAIEDKSAS